jgi:hypothetical protein
MNWYKISQNDYFYHETKREHIYDIKSEGIVPTSYGQSLVGEMGEILSPNMLDEEELENIPEEDLIPRTYYMEQEPRQLLYGDILLRFPKRFATKRRIDVDSYILNSISPEVIEVKVENQWIPLRNFGQPINSF